MMTHTLIGHHQFILLEHQSLLYLKADTRGELGRKNEGYGALLRWIDGAQPADTRGDLGRKNEGYGALIRWIDGSQPGFVSSCNGIGLPIKWHKYIYDIYYISVFILATNSWRNHFRSRGAHQNNILSNSHYISWIYIISHEFTDREKLRNEHGKLKKEYAQLEADNV